MSRTWPEVLDAYEAALQSFSELHHDGDEVLPEFSSPVGLGPLPREHEARARALLIRSHELEAAVRAARDQVSQHLVLVGRSRTDRPGATYVDQHV